MDSAKTPKLRLRAGIWTCQQAEKRCTSSREEEEVDAQMCPCGNAIERECETYMEKRDVLEDKMRKINECDMEEFDTLDGREKTIAIL